MARLYTGFHTKPASLPFNFKSYYPKPESQYQTPSDYMSSCDSIHQYYLHQHHVIERCYDGFTAGPDPELVHQLRLGIKKLKAFEVLSAYLLPEGESRERNLNKDLKQLFKIAGELRDTQVQIKMLAEFEQNDGHNLTEFEVWLIKREKKRIRQFSEKRKAHGLHPLMHDRHRETSDILARADDDAILKSATTALQCLYTHAYKLSGVDISDKNLHKLRTITKKMRYIYSMVHHSYPSFEYDKISIASLREIEVAAGHWHDCLVGVELLGIFIDGLDENDQDLILKYRSLPELFKSRLDEAYNVACKLSVEGFCW